MSDRLLAPLAVTAAVLVLLGLSAFTVGEGESAVRTRFGQVQDSAYAPGLHWCWPFERIQRIDRRVLGERLQGETFLGSEQQGLVVDIALAWRVRDPVAYLRSGAGDEQAVNARLGDAVRGELKAAYAQQPLAKIIAAPRGGITPGLMARLEPVASGLGIELIDARVKRIDPTDEVANAIYARMQAAYAAQTRQVRAEGAAEGERLRAEADRNRAEILAAANRDAQRLRGEADAQAAAIYARAYGVNPEFAAFYRSLQAYRSALGREGDILVIEPDGEFYKYLHGPARP
jgi:modulator of FtsH protease HflC